MALLKRRGCIPSHAQSSGGLEPEANRSVSKQFHDNPFKLRGNGTFRTSPSWPPACPLHDRRLFCPTRHFLLNSLQPLCLTSSLECEFRSVASPQPTNTQHAVHTWAACPSSRLNSTVHKSEAAASQVQFYTLSSSAKQRQASLVFLASDSFPRGTHTGVLVAVRGSSRSPSAVSRGSVRLVHLLYVGTNWRIPLSAQSREMHKRVAMQ